MSNIGDDTLQAFFDEIVKISAWNGFGSMGALGGVGALAGGVIGAASGGAQGYRAARERGENRLTSAVAGLGQGMSGGLTGAAVGGAVGTAGGAGAALISPGKAESLRKALTTSSLTGVGARFGQRQAHGLTGWTPQYKGPRDALAEIGMGSSLREDAVHAARQKLEEARTLGPQAERTIGDRLLGRTGVEGAEKRLSSAKSSLEAADEAERRGLTSVPGYLSGLRRDPVGTLRSAAKNELSGNPASIAFQVGLPAVGVAQELRKDHDPNHPDESRFRRALRPALNAATNIAMSPLPAFTTFGLQGVGGSIASRFSKKPQGTVMPPKAPDLTADNGQAVAGERIVSERAAGSLGEGSPS